jgi:hypothetical protein
VTLRQVWPCRPERPWLRVGLVGVKFLVKCHIGCVRAMLEGVFGY